MNKKGENIRISGIWYKVVDVRWSPDSAIPTYILYRFFDGSFHYAKCSRLSRFSNLKRIEDKSHEYLTNVDVMSGMDESYRRI